MTTPAEGLLPCPICKTPCTVTTEMNIDGPLRTFVPATPTREALEALAEKWTREADTLLEEDGAIGYERCSSGLRALLSAPSVPTSKEETT